MPRLVPTNCISSDKLSGHNLLCTSKLNPGQMWYSTTSARVSCSLFLFDLQFHMEVQVTRFQRGSLRNHWYLGGRIGKMNWFETKSKCQILETWYAMNDLRYLSSCPFTWKLLWAKMISWLLLLMELWNVEIKIQTHKTQIFSKDWHRYIRPFDIIHV